jgi:glycosyltransferase involved in cell wall biosynthesis
MVLLTQRFLESMELNMQTHKPLVVWISWQYHRRTVELCQYFDIKLIVICASRWKAWRYIQSSIATVRYIYRHRPKVLIVQNPSVVLTLLACVLKKAFGYRLIVDTHNCGIIPENAMLKNLSVIYRYIHLRSDITVVSNAALSKFVLNDKGHPYVMPDKIPDIVCERRKHDDRFIIVYICTFGKDEPYAEFLAAARYFSNGIEFYVTGDINKCRGRVATECRRNVTFTGFLPDDEYWKLLRSADLIIDLTYRENCLLCGAYEAVAAEVPLVLSDTRALRKFFDGGVIFSKNTTGELVESIAMAIENNKEMSRDIVQLKVKITKQWVREAQIFSAQLEKMCNQ